MRLAITGSPDTTLIIWCLGTDHTYSCELLFPYMIRCMTENTSMLTTVLHWAVWMIARETFKEAQVQSTSEVERQKWHYDRKANAPFHWRQVTWSWLKLTCLQGKEERWRIGGRRNHTKWSAKLWKASLPTLWQKQQTGHSLSPPMKLTFSHCSNRGDSSSVCLYRLRWARCTNHHPRGTNSRRKWDWESITKWELSITSPEHQPGETPLWWVNMRLHAFVHDGHFQELPG